MRSSTLSPVTAVPLCFLRWPSTELETDNDHPAGREGTPSRAVAMSRGAHPQGQALSLPETRPTRLRRTAQRPVPELVADANGGYRRPKRAHSSKSFARGSYSRTLRAASRREGERNSHERNPIPGLICADRSARRSRRALHRPSGSTPSTSADESGIVEALPFGSGRAAGIES